MLAHLALYLTIMLSGCTMMLLICWVHDTVGAEIEARRSRPAVLEFHVDHHAIRSHLRFRLPTLSGPRRRALPQRESVRELGVAPKPMRRNRRGLRLYIPRPADAAGDDQPQRDDGRRPRPVHQELDLDAGLVATGHSCQRRGDQLRRLLSEKEY
jgi:hypothetical protein